MPLPLSGPTPWSAGPCLSRSCHVWPQSLRSGITEAEENAGRTLGQRPGPMAGGNPAANSKVTHGDLGTSSSQSESPVQG